MSTRRFHIAFSFAGEKRGFVAQTAACKGRSKSASATALVTELLEARESRALARLQKQLERLGLLIPDELGCVPFSKTGAELLFDAFSRACSSPNLPFENWTEILGSERQSGTMPDRRLHHSTN